MKQYTFVDWNLVRSTPMRHTYRCGWREMLLGTMSHRASKRPTRRHITIEWDGKEQLTVRRGRMLSSKSQWASTEVKNIVFGIRELGAKERVDSAAPGWLWFIHLTGRSSGVLAEFLVSLQHDSPSTSRAHVPARVQELLNWLGRCTGHRVHGPVLVTDEVSRRRILSHVD